MTMPPERKPRNRPLDHLPEDLLAQIGPELTGEVARASAPCDLDASGTYTEGYLVLTDRRLGHFVRGDGAWRGEWIEIGKIGEAQLVEGLGMNLLRLLSDGRKLAEYRFTLRNARAIAKIHRHLERKVRGESEDDRPIVIPRHADQKKVRCGKCGQIIPSWSEVCPACTSRRTILMRLLDFVKPYRGRAIAGLLVAMAITAIGLIPPYLSKPLINYGLGAAKGVDADYGLVVTLVSVMAALIVLTVAGRIVQGRLIFRLGSKITRDIRHTVYAHLHRLSLSFFAKKQTGGLVARITSDAERIWRFVALAVVDMVVSVLTLAGVGVALFVMEWKLACFVLMPIPVMFGLFVVFHSRLHGIFRRMWHRYSMMTAVIADALPGVRVIKAFSQEDREVERFDEKNTALYDEEMRFISTASAFGPLIMFCSQIGALIIWLLGGWWAITGRLGPEGVGTLVAFTGYMGMFMRPIHMLAHLDQQLNRAATSAQRIFEILDTEPAVFSEKDAARAETLAGKVELRDVSFSYDGIRKVLKDVSLRVEPGEMVGLAGPSGAGKTTLVNLICRFYDVLEGQILIDDVDVRDYDLTDLRRRLGVVLQEPFLFHGTVAENIAYGKPSATLDEIIAAARAANAHEFIVGFPDGYDTLVGERGQSLSGGERQRISIARAILNNPRVLILDEATSSVDTETEKLIQEALDRLIANRTTIAIAHRLSTLRKADRLVIMDKGEIIEEGSHEELAEIEDGLYAKLLRMQQEAQSVVAL
jgi:ATP-binding cassette subfamily B protein